MDATTQQFGVMETEFRAKRASGRKLLVPYITGGLTHWPVSYTHLTLPTIYSV